MEHSYNQVTPIALRKKNKNKNGANTIQPTRSGVSMNQPNTGLPMQSQMMGNNNNVMNYFNPVAPNMFGNILPGLPGMFNPGMAGSMENVSQIKMNNNSSNKKRKANLSTSNGMPSSNKWGLDSMGGTQAAEKRRKRAERFNSNVQENTTGQNVGIKNSFDPLNEEEDYSNLNAIATKSHKYDKNKHIVGTCQTLEKSYLRLTSEPNPELVRPLNILKKAYTLLMEKHQKKEVTYTYLCDQFKAIRQDLRVQMIENKFTVKVYETHARLALVNGDLGEFNQCQSRLLILFENPNIKKTSFEEFMSYLILYHMLTEDNAAITSLRLKLRLHHNDTFKHSLVQKSFQLAEARLRGNYHLFMKVCDSITSLGKHLINAFIEKEILKSLNTICRSYNQISVEFLKDELHFPTTETVALFFNKKGLGEFIITKNQGKPSEYIYLDTKSCRTSVALLYQKSRKIDIKGQK